MNIVFVHNSRIPTEKAHGLQIVKMCEAFAKLGHNVTLCAPSPKGSDVFSFYSVKRNFTFQAINSIKVPYVFGVLNQSIYFLNSLIYFISIIFSGVSRSGAIYTRHIELAICFKVLGYKVLFDAHTVPNKVQFFYKRLFRIPDVVITNSRGTSKAIDGLARIKSYFFQNAVDLDDMERAIKETHFSDLVITEERPIIMYVGHLYAWKGIDVVVEVAQKAEGKLPYMFVCIGGTNEDIEKYRLLTKGRGNIQFLGYKGRDEVFSYMKSSNVLLLPNVPISKESSDFTSPIKMFEYMATGVPVVASDMASIREVLNDNNATMVKPGDAEALLAGIEIALSNEGKDRSKQAKKDVQKYTWVHRAKAIGNILCAE